MTKFYDCILFILTLLVCAAFIWLQKDETPFIPPVVRPRVQEAFQPSPGSGSGSYSSTILPTRTAELSAAKKTICNLQKVFDTLKCSTYLASNPNPPGPLLDTSRATVPQPSVAIRGNIDHLSDTAVANGNLTGMIRPNDMLYFGHLLDMQGPFVVKSVSLASPIASEPSVFAGSGTITYVGGDGTGTAASFASPSGITIDSAGNLYVADSHRIRKITPAGVVTTLAGSGTSGTANGQGAAASFNGVQGLTIDSLGNLYAADTMSNSLRKISPGGLVTTVPGTTFTYPMGVAADSEGNIYTADWFNNVIKKTTVVGVTTVYAGDGNARFADGAVTSSGVNNSFNRPGGVAIHPVTGDIYVADGMNNSIRRISATSSTTRMVSTYAGTGVEGNVDGPAATARFKYPRGLTFDSAGNLYVADVGNNSVRRISPAGEVNTIASNLESPIYLVFDPIGNLYITSSGASRVYMISASTVLTLTKKYVGTNIRNSILSFVPSSADATATSGTIPVVESGDADEAKKEVYTFGTKTDYTLATAQAACATFGADVATLAQFKQANMQGLQVGPPGEEYSSSLTKNDSGDPIVLMSLQNRLNDLPSGIISTPANANNSRLACYGIKPPQGTVAPNGGIILPFSTVPLLYNNPTTIVGSIRAGTSYIATTNAVVPDDLSIGDLVYIQGRCNAYDTDNGDGTCTAYDCTSGEKDLLNNNQCQRFTCRDKAQREDTHVNNGDGTCTIPPQYDDCLENYTTSSAPGQSGICDSLIRGTQYQKTVQIPAYTYDAIRGGKPSTRYTKTAQNPSYRYPKTLGPYYIAANPAIGNIQLKSKTPGDLDVSGHFMSISSARVWRLAAVGVGWIGSTIKNNKVLTGSTRSGMYQSVSADPSNTSVMAVDADAFVWYADTTLNAVPNWDMVYMFDPRHPAPYLRIQTIQLRQISHSNGQWVGIAMDSTSIVYGKIRRRLISYDARIVDKPGYVFNANSFDPTLTYDAAANRVGRIYRDEGTRVQNVVEDYTNITGTGITARPAHLSFDARAMTLICVDVAQNVWYADQEIITSPNWEQVYEEAVDPVTNSLIPFRLNKISHSTQQWAGIYNNTVLHGTIRRDWIAYSTTVRGMPRMVQRQLVLVKSTNITDLRSSGGSSGSGSSGSGSSGSGTFDGVQLKQISFDGETNSVAVLTSRDTVVIKDLSSLQESVTNRVSASFGLQTVSMTKVTSTDAIVTSLVKRGTIINYDKCITHGIVLDLAYKNRIPGDDSAANTTKLKLCHPFFTNDGWTGGGNTADTRKDMYKKATGLMKGVPVNKKILGCAKGTYGDFCTQCPAGETSSSIGAVACSPCAAGTFSATAGATSCNQCAAGTFSAARAATCTACPAGKYSAAGAASCGACPAGYSCSSTGTVTPGICAAGTFSPEGSLNCTACPAGKYSAAAGAGSCDSCPAGTMCSTTGVVRPEPCAAGRFSAAGSTNCSACPAGEYSAAGAASCSRCPAGTMCPFTGTVTPQQCAAGTSSSAGATTCTSCPAGTSSLAGAGSCSPCPAGTSSLPGAASCTTCPAGTSSLPGAGSCTTCANNTTSAAGAASCTPCPTDTYSSGGDVSCRACGNDTPFRECLGVYYSVFSATSEKVRLPSVVRLGDPITARYVAGFQPSTSRVRYVLSQSDGTISQEITSSTGSATFNGIHSKLTSNSSMGKQTITAYDVQWAAPGQPGTLIGSGVVVTLPICEPGFVWSGTSCTPCPAGWTSLTGALNCTECPGNSYTTGTGGACISCPIGTYNQPGEGSCTACGYDTGEQTCVGVTYKSYIDPMRASQREGNRIPSYDSPFSLELPSAVRQGTPITVKLYSENNTNEPLNTYGFTFELFQGNYFNLPTRVVVNPQEVTSSYVSATFAGSHSIPAGPRGNGKQFIVVYDNLRRIAVGGVVVTLP